MFKSRYYFDPPGGSTLLRRTNSTQLYITWPWPWPWPCPCQKIDLSPVQTGWPNELRVSLPFWEIAGFRLQRFKLWPSQTNDLKIDICRFLL